MDEDALHLFEHQRGLAASQAGGDIARPVVPVGQDLVVEEDHQHRENSGGRQHRTQQVEEADPAGLGGHDFVVRGQAGKSHEHGDEHGHGHGQGDDPGQVVEQQLDGQQQGQSLAEHLVHHLQDDVHE